MFTHPYTGSQLARQRITRALKCTRPAALPS
jgi:hypothetical protein